MALWASGLQGNKPHKRRPPEKRRKEQKRIEYRVVVIRRETMNKKSVLVKKRGKKLPRQFKCIKNPHFHPKNP
jgi:hypothetical protein